MRPRLLPSSAEPPPGTAPRPVVGYERWHEVLLLHWDVHPDALRELVDPRLKLDLFDGRAWLSLAPYTVRGAHLRFSPRLPGFHEMCLRTCVSVGGVPGIWFLSLDASSAPLVAIARALGLPYHRARMERSASDRGHEYRSVRLRPRGGPATFAASWSVGRTIPDPPGSIDRFLTERYALHSTLAGRLLRVRVRLQPWALREARIERLEQTVTHAAGVEVTERPALAHFSEGVDVEVLAPELVR